MLKRREILWDPMPVPQVVAFYLGIPLVMSVLFGINHAGLARHLTILEGIAYWTGIWVPFWLMLDVATRASAVALRPWSPPLWLILLLGAGLAMLLSRPYILWYVGHYLAALPESVYEPVPALGAAWQELDRALAFAGTPAFWITVNYYYDRVLGIPRYRGRLMQLNPTDAADVAATSPEALHATQRNENAVPAHRLPDVGVAALHATDRMQSASPSPGPASAGLAGPAALLSLVPAKIGAEVIALQAEDHYVRVHTTLGSALVRYRFGDALRDVEPLEGLQVHRSFWVRRSHVALLDRAGAHWSVVLSNGERVPVSQGYRGAVRAAKLPEATPRRRSDPPVRDERAYLR